MQMYANSNLKYFEVNSLLDFLNDLRLEQKEVNGHNCQASITPVEVTSKICSFMVI
jgi:hypothetical protein